MLFLCPFPLVLVKDALASRCSNRNPDPLHLRNPLTFCLQLKLFLNSPAPPLCPRGKKRAKTCPGGDRQKSWLRRRAENTRDTVLPRVLLGLPFEEEKMANFGQIQCLQYTRCPGCRKGVAPPGAKANLVLAPDPKSALFNPFPGVMPRDGLGEGAAPSSPSLPTGSLGLGTLPAAAEWQIEEPGEEERGYFFPLPPSLRQGLKPFWQKLAAGFALSS